MRTVTTDLRVWFTGYGASHAVYRSLTFGDEPTLILSNARLKELGKGSR